MDFIKLRLAPRASKQVAPDDNNFRIICNHNDSYNGDRKSCRLTSVLIDCYDNPNPSHSAIASENSR